MIWKPNIHSPSTSELQRAGVSIDEVGVLSTPFEYLRRGKNPKYIWSVKTTRDWLLAGIFWYGHFLNFFLEWGGARGNR